jgi:hypothetical protein
MTTKAAAKLYEAQHKESYSGKNVEVFNPNSVSWDDLPTIFGFNNGGPENFLEGVLIAEDGTVLGSHTCSSESYMFSDLGILEGTYEDRHVTFREHYPDGYKMEFVSYKDLKNHSGVALAIINSDKRKL